MFLWYVYIITRQSYVRPIIPRTKGSKHAEKRHVLSVDGKKKKKKRRTKNKSPKKRHRFHNVCRPPPTSIGKNPLTGSPSPPAALSNNTLSTNVTSTGVYRYYIPKRSIPSISGQNGNRFINNSCAPTCASLLTDASSSCHSTTWKNHLCLVEL